MASTTGDQRTESSKDSRPRCNRGHGAGQTLCPATFRISNAFTLKMSSKKSKISTLAMSDILRDLAVLRANDIDLNQLHQTALRDELDDSVEKAQQLSKEAKAALKVQSQELVENEGKRIDDLRARLEDAVSGLSKSQ